MSFASAQLQPHLTTQRSQQVGWVVRYLCNLPELGDVTIGEHLYVNLKRELTLLYCLQLADVDKIANWLVSIARCVRTHRRRIVQQVTQSLRHTDRSLEDRRPDDTEFLSRLQRILPDIQQFQDSEMAGVNPCCFASGCTNSQDEVGLGLLMCSTCRGVQYCSRKCQKA